MKDHIELVIITGMSGAGKTVAMQSFEDMGYYCIDNMPPNLLPTFWKLVRESGQFSKIALVMDLRMKDFFEEINKAITTIDNTSHLTTRIVFLDATNAELVTRYKESRRAHPLAKSGRTIDGIKKERELLQDIRHKAQMVIDTTDLTPRQLRQKLIDKFKSKEKEMFRVEMVSFGFKYGVPIDADVVMDVRFLPNPHYIEELRPQTGMDKAVYDYVMQQTETEHFYKKFTDLLEYTLPGYKKEGKSNLTIAIGCTGGKHRSVALVERIARKLKLDGYPVNISHRDKDKKKESVVRS
ncbi:RNase adapter RapZ [Alkalibacterium sp. AK22]|uniref:RNase adapter RapZ n=1 Tax=Alkalibacterium sp. AK22 TaxID=1229520 RepID=UPI00054E20D2|nr:RNase adapter RapZ [Alkalibacterium sp. AK22]